MKISDLMCRDVSSCTPQQGLNVAAQIMFEEDCGCVPITDGAGHVCGMITDRDVCVHAYATGRTLQECKVADAMSSDVCTCRPDEPLEEAERVMSFNKIRRLPITDEEGTLKGILSLNDIILAKARKGSKAKGGLATSQFVDTLSSICEHAPNTRSARVSH
jgi:CBS domain-containing protein